MSSEDTSKTKANEQARTAPSGRWAKGKTGNPAGRPPGSRNKSTLFYENLIGGQAEELINKTMELALKGDTTALRLCLERIYPPRKERTIELAMPEIRDPKLLITAIPAILTAISEARITPLEGESLTRIVETGIRVTELEELSKRVSQMERCLASLPGQTLDRGSADCTTKQSAQAPEAASSAEEQSHNRNGNEIDAGQKPPQSRSTPSWMLPDTETTS